MNIEVLRQYVQTDGEHDTRKIAVAIVPLAAVAFWFHGIGAGAVMILFGATVNYPLIQGKESQLLPITVAWITGGYVYLISDPTVVTPALVVGFLSFIVVELYQQSG